MNSVGKKIALGVVIAIIVGVAGFFVYMKVNTTKPIQPDRANIDHVSVLDIRSGYEASLTEKDQIEDALNILGEIKAYRTKESTEDYTIENMGKVHIDASIIIKYKEKGEVGTDMITYGFYGEDLGMSTDEKMYKVKPSVYDKIAEVSKKYGEYSELVNSVYE
ncbi:MAG: hypothetical protein J1E62_05695 [Lachnospiraceae bacterium]|nr:hypothetical protein [Lachnospiraceae bacterium]